VIFALGLVTFCFCHSKELTCPLYKWVNPSFHNLALNHIHLFPHPTRMPPPMLHNLLLTCSQIPQTNLPCPRLAVQTSPTRTTPTCRVCCATSPCASLLSPTGMTACKDCGWGVVLRLGLPSSIAAGREACCGQGDVGEVGSKDEGEEQMRSR
jgi:hypothetical protein